FASRPKPRAAKVCMPPPHRRRLRRRTSVTDTALRPSHFWVRQKVVPLPARVSLLSGIYVTTEIPDLQAIAVQRCLYHSLARILEAPLELIFMLRGAPKAHEVCLETGQTRRTMLQIFRGFAPCLCNCGQLWFREFT